MSEDLLVEPPAERGMTTAERRLAEDIYKAIQRDATETDRGAQAAEFKVGVSDLGYCSERTKRMLDRQVPEHPDMLLAWIGTALGDRLERAIEKSFPDMIRQPSVTVTLTGDTRTFEVPGHPDIILPTDGIVLDAKTSFGLALARRMGADQQKRFQRHCYAKGAHEAGLFGDLPLDQVQVGNVWLDRSGVEREVHVELEPYDEGVIFAATQWLEEVIEAYLNGAEARKEPPREVCASTCGFFLTCRALDTDVSGLLTGDETLAAVDLYNEGKELEKKGKRFKAESKAALHGVAGSTGKHTVRWVEVGESQVPTFTRSGYLRLDIRAIK